jgi:hypothetical protein
VLFVQFSQNSVTFYVLGQDYPKHFGMERRAFCLFKSTRTKISLISIKLTDRPGLKNICIKRLRMLTKAENFEIV